jgi:hypothetical protein
VGENYRCDKCWDNKGIKVDFIASLRPFALPLKLPRPQRLLLNPFSGHLSTRWRLASHQTASRYVENVVPFGLVDQ